MKDKQKDIVRCDRCNSDVVGQISNVQTPDGDMISTYVCDMCNNIFDVPGR